MIKSYYESTIKDFISTDDNKVLGALASSENTFDITPKTTIAWQGEISVIKNSMLGVDGFIHFEFVIPRMGKRVDVLLVICNVIFVVEFKVNADKYDASSVTQLVDYSLDLKNFHEGSHDKIICPVLVCTQAKNTNLNQIISKDLIFSPILTNGKNLNEIINFVLENSKDRAPNINHHEW